VTGIDQSDPPKQKASRRYSDKTLKILFAMSMNECAHPSCTQPVIQPKSEASDVAVIGQIAHIYAASDNGPRGKAGLTEKERNHPDNLILLCPTHHVVVDQQHASYPASLLLEWRSTHERKFQEVLGAQISDVGFHELELTARSLMSAQSAVSPGSLKTIPPDEKIRKNGLGGRSKMLLTMGAANSAEVEDVLLKASQLDPDFADKLREGFVRKYGTFFEEGLRGDDLFMAMYAWAGGASRDKSREAGGLCILAHLFLICDVFEK
jgi:hypothetical protein